MVKLSIRPAPTLMVKSDSPYSKHAAAVTDWTRDAEQSLRTLETAVNGVRDSHVATTTGSVTLSSESETIILDQAAGTATLPSAETVPGRSFTVKLIRTPTNGTSVKVVGVAAQTIDGAAPATGYPLSAKYKYVTVQSDGANWHVIASN